MLPSPFLSSVSKLGMAGLLELAPDVPDEPDEDAPGDEEPEAPDELDWAHSDTGVASAAPSARAVRYRVLSMTCLLAMMDGEGAGVTNALRENASSVPWRVPGASTAFACRRAAPVSSLLRGG